MPRSADQRCQILERAHGGLSSVLRRGQKWHPEKDQGVPLRGSLDCEAKSGRVGREYNRWRAGERSGRQKGAGQLGRLGETFKFGQSG